MGIKEIARKAGVSIATVDRVLHNRGRVSPETRKKIEKIIRDHDYHPNLIARSLKSMGQKTIALLIPQPEEDEYWEQAWKGFENQFPRVKQQGIEVESFFYSLRDQNQFTARAEEIMNTKPDGLIMAPNFLRESIRLFDSCQSAAIPVVMFDTIPPGTDPVCFIGTDSYQAGRLGAHLLGMISRTQGDMAIFHFDEELSNSPHMMEKERGFFHYLGETGREGRSFVINSSQDYESRLEKIFDTLDIAGALVSTSKTYLVGSYLKKTGNRSIKLAGFDLVSKNIELMQEGYIDILIHQNPGRQAARSLNTLVNFMVYKEKVKKQRLFPTDIITKVNLDSYL